MFKSRGFTTHQSVHGFTLIELLITISIIAILSAIGMIAYSAVLKQGRDAKRHSDLRTIQSALEQYHSDQGSYPISGGSCSDNGHLISGCPFKDPTGNKTYINIVPNDPITANSRIYRFELTTSSYVLCALFEVTPTLKPSECTMKCSSEANGWCNGGVSPP